MVTTVRIVGPGRAGRSLAAALTAAGVEVLPLLGRSDDCRQAARSTDVLVLAVPDREVSAVAASIETLPGTVVLHVAGSLGLDVLAPHPRRASLHPLVTLPDPVTGAARLRSGCYFAVAGDAVATDLALVLRGHPVVVPEAERPAYHAAACIAANHLVALLGQVERVAASTGLPLEAFLPLARGALDDVSLVGPAAALTGPAARGDFETLERHRATLDPGERDGYEAGVELVMRLQAARVATAGWS
jgi:predicted short-subunit dehydrogenase-like oxidoreductase (DUF2520 family)